MLSEPIKKVVEMLKIWTKMSVEDEKLTQNALRILVISGGGPLLRLVLAVSKEAGLQS
jgi:hypothetical protein